MNVCADICCYFGSKIKTSYSMNILIADGGSTKADWALVVDGTVQRRFATRGINPMFQDADSMLSALTDDFGDWLALQARAVYFYGAGCIGGAANQRVADALSALTGAGQVSVASDLLGAARAMCQRAEGVVCILGTGANSCYFDGQDIAANVPPLGFILGDEGSGANIGKRLVADALKGLLPDGLKERMLQWCGLDYAGIIQRVYREAYPNRFLASFARFARENIAVPEVEAIVMAAFADFAERNLMQYAGIERLPVHFVGSVAYHFEPQLSKALALRGITLGKVMQSPIDGMVMYHSL